MEVHKRSNGIVSNTQSSKGQTIKFNLDSKYLKCFISDTKPNKSRKHQEKMESLLKSSQNSQEKQIKPLNFYFRQSGLSCEKGPKKCQHSLFNQKLLIIQYDQTQFINSNNIIKKQSSAASPTRLLNLCSCQKVQQNKKDNQANFNQNIDEDIMAECLRVITEETDNTSNPSKDSSNYACQIHGYNTFYPYYQNYPYSYYQQSNTRVQEQIKTRNKKPMPYNDGQLFRIDPTNIQKDGRTTLMLRNIPNKYTRDMILDQINSFKDFKKKYDFFYLPIDYRNQCNVGYAFINLIHYKFIEEFYEKFHEKKWQKFNSQKICNVCYARIQGTAQLLNHFKDSNVLQQKDKKIRPIIDFKDEGIAQIVERQKNQSSNNISLD